MITKLKWLKAYFTRNVLPAVGATVGEVLYTAKNATGRRKQYVINLDAKTTQVTTIDAAPASITAKTGQIIETTIASPCTATSLYVFNSVTASYMPIELDSTLTIAQQILNGAAIAAVSILTGATNTNYAGTNVAATLGGAGNSVATVISAVGLTLNTATGVVTLDDNLTPGTYTLTYTLADKTEPTVYVTGTVTIIVDAEITATADALTILNSTAYNGSAGIINILTNDTFDLILASVVDVTITQLAGGDAELVLNTTTGAINVAAGTAAGVYTKNYRITDKLDVLNFSDATVTITVSTPLVLVATADTASVTAAEGLAGKLAVVNVLTNDTIDGGPASGFVTVSTITPNANLLLNADGTVDVIAGTTGAPTDYVLTYRITETLNASNFSNNTVTVTVSNV